MTLKQRRRHGDLMDRLDVLKRDPYLQPPDDYQVGENPDEDEKYRAVMTEFTETVEALHALEEAARQGN